MSRATAVLQNLQAEKLLQGSYVLTQIDSLRANLRYQTNGETVSYDDFYLKLQNEIEGLPKLTLATDVAPGTENQYTMQLISGMEKVADDAGRVVRRLIHFQSKLRNALSQIKKLNAAFNAWYTLAAGEALDENGAKFPSNQLKDLANSEFSRLMQGMDVEVETMLEAVKVQAEQIKQFKKTQDDKFDYGKDQANASWTGSLPNFGEPPERSDQRLEPRPVEEEDLEDVPAFISKKPQVGTEPVGFIPDTASKNGKIEVIVPDEVKAVFEKDPSVFKKVGPPVAITPIVSDAAPGAPAIVELPKPAPIADLTSVFGNAVEVKSTPAPAPKKDAKPKKAALEYRQPVDSEMIVLRDSDPAEKIKCVVCDRRIRSKQEMFARDGGFAHVNPGDCTDKAVTSDAPKTAPLTPSQEWLKKAADAEDGCGPIMACSPELLAASGGDPNNHAAISETFFAAATAVLKKKEEGTILEKLEAGAAASKTSVLVPAVDLPPTKPLEESEVIGTTDAPATPRKRLQFVEEEIL